MKSFLRQKIEAEIRERGPIPFSRYMELCLYDATDGYYARNAEQFGKAGDFYTSSDVHAVFGRLMARQFEQMWRLLDSPPRIDLVELGPGRGLFAQDVLGWSEKKFPEFFDALCYVLVERSSALRSRMEAALAARLEAGKAEFAIWGDGTGIRQNESLRKSAGGQLLVGDYPAIIFANEFFDALPVEVVSSQGSLRIGCREGRLVESWGEPSEEEMGFLDRYSVHADPGERLEVSLVAARYMDEIAARLERGFAVVVDYGYVREEQFAGRHRGTLKAIRQHSISGSPYDAPGEQDITADVNFTALAAAAQRRGLLTQKLVTQSQFLLGIGELNQFADAFEECRLPQERAKVGLQLKHLITPAGMGESFHVLVSSKGVAPQKVALVSGLHFGRNSLLRQEI